MKRVFFKIYSMNQRLLDSGYEELTPAQIEEIKRDAEYAHPGFWFLSIKHNGYQAEKVYRDL